MPPLLYSATKFHAVIVQAGNRARQGGLAQMPCAIICQAVARAGFIGADQLAIEVVGVGSYAIPGQVTNWYYRQVAHP
ncbi:hypothetical protein Nstercoris_01030 [Nitrosomonas stercoris]|uniref:Uncharacterized protein n=1 Tax=Nitrosomonas stercoris TaxID=1444684 RepID=A0A4Y1YLT3_9PROT|nr:hypothetical protein Nstercoris_01030 [Nitrosomonas stercoris]